MRTVLSSSRAISDTDFNYEVAQLALSHLVPTAAGKGFALLPNHECQQWRKANREGELGKESVLRAAQDFSSR
jgi:hypothetical protein